LEQQRVEREAEERIYQEEQREQRRLEAQKAKEEKKARLLEQLKKQQLRDAEKTKAAEEERALKMKNALELALQQQEEEKIMEQIRIEEAQLALMEEKRRREVADKLARDRIALCLKVKNNSKLSSTLKVTETEETTSFHEFKFNGKATIQTICNGIGEKIESSKGEYGIFWVNSVGVGEWLRMDKQLSDYKIKKEVRSNSESLREMN
jgi:hypothetical protein